MGDLLPIGKRTMGANTIGENVVAAKPGRGFFFFYLTFKRHFVNRCAVRLPQYGIALRGCPYSVVMSPLEKKIDPPPHFDHFRGRLIGVMRLPAPRGPAPSTKRA